MNYRALTAALLALSLSSAAFADIIELTDGRKFTGTFSRSGDVITIKSDDGKIVNVKPADLAKITLTSTITPEEAAASEWNRIPSQIKTATTLQAVIDLYQKFLDKYPSAKQADDAKASLTLYKTMTDKDPVNFRGRWMPRAQVDITLKQWADAARPALDLYQAGRLKEALEAALPIIQADNQNPDALTIAGLVQYRLSNLPAARTYFTALAAADPGSVLAENNLAVVSTGQKQPGEALIHYIKAVQLAPQNRLVLDNIAEALNTYVAGNGDKTSTNYRALVKAFEPSESAMQAVMLKAGNLRWGSTWVTRDQKARLDAAMTAISTMMTNLDAQYASITRNLTAIQGQIRQAQADSNNDLDIANTATAFVLANTGIIADTAFYNSQRSIALQNYDMLQRYIAQLQNEYNAIFQGTRDYITQADKLTAAFKSGGIASQYTGNQRIMDWGQADNPPAAVPVAEISVPTLQLPPIIVTPPSAPAAPVVVPIPVNPPVFVPVPHVTPGPGH